MSWLRRIILSQLKNEDFITPDGIILYSDGDYNHDMHVMKYLIDTSIEDSETVKSLSPEDLSENEAKQIESEFPNFMRTVWKGSYLPKEFAVEYMGWIRVLGDNFELRRVDEHSLNLIADYVFEMAETTDGRDIEFTINELGGSLVDMRFSELSEALDRGQGMQLYILRKQSQAYNSPISPGTYIWD